MANLINSIKAFGEKVTGEKIEGTTLIDSMKDMGKKMTGKEIEGNSLLAIIDETTEGYEGGSGLEPITIQEDTYDVTIDGIKLLNLLKSLNVDVDAELDYSSASTNSGIVLGLTYDDNDDAIDNGSNISLGRVCDSHNDFAILKVATFTWENKIQLTTTPVTFTSLLTDIGSDAVFESIQVWKDLTILPMLAVRTGSSYSSTVYQLSNDDFNAIVKFEPKEFESEE